MRDPVVGFTDRVEPGPLRNVMDTLSAVIGKTSSLADVPMLSEAAGFVTAAAAASPGTSVPVTRATVDLADAGTDQARLVVYGKNSGAGAVTIALYDVTNAVILATVDVTGTVAASYAGAWTTVTPSGIDHEIEVRVIGSGETPTLYTVHAQLRTLQARK